MDALHAIHHLHTADPLDCDDITTNEINPMSNASQSASITNAERALGSFTCRRLNTLDTWPIWHSAEFTQLDQFHALGMYGKPLYPPKTAFILNSYWQYRIKTSSKCRSCNCCNGSPCAAPKLHALAQTYASCIKQPIFHLFCALSAALNMLIYGGDAQDAFTHSPTLKIPTYLCINDAFANWYKDQFKIDLDQRQVLPIQDALQGHPEAA
jgi:hypothetical protein